MYVSNSLRAINKKKFAIIPLYKRIIIITAIIILISSIFYMIYSIRDKYEHDDVSIYEYNSNANISYNVQLKNNAIYNNNMLGEGLLYVSKLTDKINANLNFELQGTQNAQINGKYRVIAYLEALAPGDKGKRAIWKKEIVILPYKNFKFNQKEININENVSIDFKKIF